jgi:AcrR family transcriptional regulator
VRAEVPDVVGQHRAEDRDAQRAADLAGGVVDRRRDALLVVGQRGDDRRRGRRGGERHPDAEQDQRPEQVPVGRAGPHRRADQQAERDQHQPGRADDRQPEAPRRRSGSPETRDAILRAARELFAAHGYDGTTLRAVAERAGVDVALSSYYFGYKADLFAAALELPVSPVVALGGVLAQSERRDDLAKRLLTTLVGLWDQAGGGPLAALLRSATSQEDLLRAFIEREILPLLATAIDGEDAGVREAAAASQVVGLVMLRYVLRVEPLASAPPERVVATVAPALQAYFSARP